jgi:Ser/Thr protein kinase RdoA (MazF antagonist)
LNNFGLDGARMTPLRHQHNTTFKVYAEGGPYVLRINRPDVHMAATIGSEMAWLTALRHETDLGVPEPVATLDGSLTVLAGDPGVPESRHCVLLRWLEGRFVDDRLTPGHLRRVGALEATLQLHAEGWTPPVGFVRPRLDTLTASGKSDSIAASAHLASAGNHPTPADSDRCLELMASLMSPAAEAVVAAALDVVWATTHELVAQPGAFGLIHGDLHYENFSFHLGTARAIDFDDCGWGFYLYDLAVTLWELERRPRYDDMRAALLDEDSRLRPLPVRYPDHLRAFAILRRIQILMWVLESREHAAFRDEWQVWAGEDLAGLTMALEALR